MEEYSVYDVFTPTTPARLTFVERDSINASLVSALRTPGKQVVVYGYSGSGKTTLLVNKLHQLYDKHITSRCMDGMTFEQLVLDAFDQLSPFYTAEKGEVSRQSVDVRVSQDYFVIKSQIGVQFGSEDSSKSVRVLPPQLTPQALARFVGVANCCWVLEDFHKMPETERTKLSQIMKIFMDIADEYRNLKVIAIGAVDTARQVVEYDPEMRNRVAEIHVPLMSPEEISRIITRGGKLLNIKFDEKLIGGISRYANGLASVCHHLCLNICTSQDINSTCEHEFAASENELDTALGAYLEEASDTLKKAFENAFKQERQKKYDNARLILKALSEFPQDGALRSEIFNAITKSEPKYPQGNLTSFLKKLFSTKSDSLIKYDANSGKYSFADPLYRSFAIALFSRSGPKLSGDKTRLRLEGLFEIVRGRLAVELRSEIFTKALSINSEVQSNSDSPLDK